MSYCKAGMHRIRFRLRLRPRPRRGSLQRSLKPSSWILRGPASKGKEGRGLEKRIGEGGVRKGGKGREGEILVPQRFLSGLVYETPPVPTLLPTPPIVYPTCRSDDASVYSRVYRVRCCLHQDRHDSVVFVVYTDCASRFSVVSGVICVLYNIETDTR